MKKQVSKIVLAFALMAQFAGFSQSNVQRCNTYAAMDALFAADPQAKIRYEAAQKELADSETQTAGAAGKAASGPVYTVSVVFHILHTYNNGIISDQACVNALSMVNSDFSRKGQDTASIASPFRQRYIDSEIRFEIGRAHV